MKLTFFWQGFNGRYGKWEDGLYAAMKLIEQEHEVQYLDTSDVEKVFQFNPDVVLYWEAPVTQRGKDATHWNSICALPYKKCLLFAGGPLKAIDVKDFDLVFVESKINEEDCEREGIPYKRAFGTNTQLFKPMETPKVFDAFMQATFADWKRHNLFAQTMGSKGAVAGRRQLFDDNGYQECVKRGVQIYDETYGEELNKLINSSSVVLNTSNEQGGGQRCTLEAMSAGVPVIVMADSIKNREFVEESGGGIVCEPEVSSIRDALRRITPAMGILGHAYVKNYWSEFEYRDALLDGIQSII